MHRLRYFLALNKTYLPTSRQFILPYSSSAIKNNGKISNKLDSSATDQEIEKVLETCVYKKKLSVFKSIRKFEKEHHEKLIYEIYERIYEENRKSEKEKIEKEVAQGDLNLVKLQLSTLNANFLKLKGAIHIRGVFEQWESQFLSVDGARAHKWKKYFEQNPEKFKNFQNFWPKPDEIDIHFVANEIQNFYRWLSERIHFAYNIGDEVEWYRKKLTPVRNNIAEHMCKELNIKYIICDKDIDNIEIIENIQTIVHDKKEEIKIINDKISNE
ncbi:hypothetical protein Glove_485g19 [Diversispora epigaea]|uniref:Uncharacterized protein n=1 Tax=Diversispora epigaea TaxID=1348612 RepID=A0A397GMU1_9GLOM|nr:hypothetical protein Glove_485g19 [Diversispora epigaea]